MGNEAVAAQFQVLSLCVSGQRKIAEVPTGAVIDFVAETGNRYVVSEEC